VSADPATNTAFIAIAAVDAAMLKSHPSDGLGPDHLQLPETNPCGVIISMNVNDQFEATSAQVGAISRWCPAVTIDTDFPEGKGCIEAVRTVPYVWPMMIMPG
jgi:hypothetical protein